MATRSGKTLAISPPIQGGSLFSSANGADEPTRRRSVWLHRLFVVHSTQDRNSRATRLLTRTYLQKRKQGPFGAQFGATCTRASKRPSRVCAGTRVCAWAQARITCDPQVARTHRNPLKLLRPKTGQFFTRSVRTPDERSDVGPGRSGGAAQR